MTNSDMTLAERIEWAMRAGAGASVAVLDCGLDGFRVCVSDPAKAAACEAVADAMTRGGVTVRVHYCD